MLSAESYVDGMIDWWKDKGLTRKSSCSVKRPSPVKCL